MAIRQRRIEVDYLKVGEEFKLLGFGFSTIDEKPNAQTRETRYINDVSTSTSVVGYKREFDYESDQIESDEVIEYIVNIAKEGKTGGECETEYVRVDTDKESSTEGSYYARKFKVAVQVNEMPNNDGDLGANGVFLCLGDAIIGSFDKTTKTFTEGFTPKAKV